MSYILDQIRLTWLRGVRPLRSMAPLSAGVVRIHPAVCATLYHARLVPASCTAAAGFLFIKGVNGFNAEAERQDKLDGYM